MAHYDEVGIVAHHLDSVLQSLSFRCGSGGGVGEPYDSSAETVDGCLKAEARAGGRLEKESRHYFAVKDFSVGIGLEARGAVKKP